MARRLYFTRLVNRSGGGAEHIGAPRRCASLRAGSRSRSGDGALRLPTIGVRDHG